ncbi:SRPBCC domain-containing protein [Sphingomonas sabuli]|uniref:SRPBCC domain-containing protein n=1 Tax=Sphingomonas sabuli TaxID=2764186 RepID=A0A7G9L0B7_9SPHN|nr:SRPBCC domain-containing protein [Sphingomonas sabuli]QNM82066.1 SRPBCC domain-containing protein [Sphingomonas sabuli]
MNQAFGTFDIVKTSRAKPAAVFGAFAFQDRKSRWYASSPGHEVISYAFDFSVGGEEKLTARMLPGTPIAGSVLCWTSTYADIVDGQRIVFFQTLDRDDARLSAATVTVTIEPDGDGTKVTLTHQAVYFEGADGPEMRRMGWDYLMNAALESADPS